MPTHELIITNQDIAVLMRVNDLAARFGLSPGDFDACLEPTKGDGTTTLHYDSSPNTEAGGDAFSRMLELLGASKDNWEVSGTVSEIIDALDRAIVRSPTSRGR